eukprot:6174463-Pyramimonas_sp.AAC.1
MQREGVPSLSRLPRALRRHRPRHRGGRIPLGAPASGARAARERSPPRERDPPMRPVASAPVAAAAQE